MAIEEKDVYEKEIFSHTFTVSGGAAQAISQISGLRGGVASVQIVATGLDGLVSINQFQGITNDFASMSPIQDGNGVDIETSVTNETYFLISNTTAIYFCLELDVLSATTGTITIKARI